MDPPPAPSSRRRTWLVPVALGLSYGLMARLAFGLDVAGEWFGIMTIAFIFVVPFAIGALTVLWQDGEPTWGEAFVLPWVPTLLAIAASIVLAWEGLICAVVWVPAALVTATVGGLVGKLVARSGRSPRALALALAALPVVFAPVETRFPDPVHLRTVHDTIEIEADAAAVWREIREVAPIRPEELDGALAYRLGFPRPIAARLVGEGVGSVREATFEGGVTFVERVTEWEENRALAFTIDANAVPTATFDQHVAVGGRYFDVLTGRYVIEEVAPGRVVLHLTSEQRLSTRFNGYTQLWTDRFMSDIQATILRVIRDRAEQAG